MKSGWSYTDGQVTPLHKQQPVSRERGRSTLGDRRQRVVEVVGIEGNALLRQPRGQRPPPNGGSHRLNGEEIELGGRGAPAGPFEGLKRLGLQPRVILCGVVGKAGERRHGMTANRALERRQHLMTHPNTQVRGVVVHRVSDAAEATALGVPLRVEARGEEERPEDLITALRLNAGSASPSSPSSQPHDDRLGLIGCCMSGRDRDEARCVSDLVERGIPGGPRAGLDARARRQPQRAGVKGDTASLRPGSNELDLGRRLRPQPMIQARHFERLLRAGGRLREGHRIDAPRDRDEDPPKPSKPKGDPPLEVGQNTFLLVWGVFHLTSSC